MEFSDSDILEVLRPEIKKLGNSCYVHIPKRHFGKKCVVLILDERFFK